jgi:hypothetical protein
MVTRSSFLLVNVWKTLLPNGQTYGKLYYHRKLYYTHGNLYFQMVTGSKVFLLVNVWKTLLPNGHRKLYYTHGKLYYQMVNGSNVFYWLTHTVYR